MDKAEEIAKAIVVGFFGTLSDISKKRRKKLSKVKTMEMR